MSERTTMNTNDGGPAFPVLTYEYKASGDLHPSPTIQSGMSLRDWFAGMALQGYNSNQDSAASSSAKIAEWSYADADAMLAERVKGEK